MRVYSPLTNSFPVIGAALAAALAAGVAAALGLSSLATGTSALLAAVAGGLAMLALRPTEDERSAETHPEVESARAAGRRHEDAGRIALENRYPAPTLVPPQDVGRRPAATKSAATMSAATIEAEIDRRVAIAVAEALEAGTGPVDHHLDHQKAEFLARMSHELRTPLNAVIGYADMVAFEVEDEDIEPDRDELAKCAAEIKRAGSNLLGMVTTVLDLTDFEAGRLDLVLCEFDAAELAREAVELASFDAAERDVTVEVLTTGSVGMTADPRLVKSILFHLVSNACKFAKGGTVRVEVADLPEMVLFTVSDDGIGMTQRQLQRALEPFSQGDESTTRTYGGMGLGLAACRVYTERMGGGLKIASTVGKGAEVGVRLPRVVIDSPHSGLFETEPTVFAR